MKKILAATVLAATVSACSDPKEPTSEGFKAAIQSRLDEQPPALCARLKVGSFDLQERKATLSFSEDERGRRQWAESANRKALDSMVEAGLVERAEQVESLGFGRKANVYTYVFKDPTIHLDQNEGQRAMARAFGSPEFQACAGSFQAGEVKSFTAPTPSNGVTMSIAEFTATAVNVPEWMTSDAVRPLVSGIESVDTPASLRATLVLHNDGWKATAVTR